MSSALAVLPAVHARFDALCRTLAKRGRGRSMQDMALAFELAQALEAELPDRAHVCALTASLGLTLADLGGA